MLSYIKNKQKPVFGVPLAQIDTIPKVLADCIEYLDTVSGLEVEGLFRKSGNFESVQDIKKLYDKGKPVNLKTMVNDPHIVCGLLKLFLRELPEPICSFECYTMFVAATGIPAEKQEARLQQIGNVLALLPNKNQILLKYLISFLRRVESCKHVNLMTSSNLATVFAPNIIRPPPGGDDLGAMLEYTPVTNTLMESFIIHYDILLRHFPEPPPIPPPPPPVIRRGFSFGRSLLREEMLNLSIVTEQPEETTAENSPTGFQKGTPRQLWRQSVFEPFADGQQTLPSFERADAPLIGSAKRNRMPICGGQRSPREHPNDSTSDVADESEPKKEREHIGVAKVRSLPPVPQRSLPAINTDERNKQPPAHRLCSNCSKPTETTSSARCASCIASLGPLSPPPSRPLPQSPPTLPTSPPQSPVRRLQKPIPPSRVARSYLVPTAGKVEIFYPSQIQHQQHQQQQQPQSPRYRSAAVSSPPLPSPITTLSTGSSGGCKIAHGKVAELTQVFSAQSANSGSPLTTPTTTTATTQQHNATTTTGTLLDSPLPTTILTPTLIPMKAVETRPTASSSVPTTPPVTVASPQLPRAIMGSGSAQNRTPQSSVQHKILLFEAGVTSPINDDLNKK